MNKYDKRVPVWAEGFWEHELKEHPESLFAADVPKPGPGVGTPNFRVYRKDGKVWLCAEHSEASQRTFPFDNYDALEFLIRDLKRDLVYPRELAERLLANIDAPAVPITGRTQLDLKIAEAANLVDRIVDGIHDGSPNIERAVALGALGSCALILKSLLPKGE